MKRQALHRSITPRKRTAPPPVAHFQIAETGTPACGRGSNLAGDLASVTCKQCGSSPFYAAACKAAGVAPTAPTKAEYGNPVGVGEGFRNYKRFSE